MSGVEGKPPAEVFDLADRVHARIRDEHCDCDPASCALRKVWVEDVLEILNVAREES